MINYDEIYEKKADKYELLVSREDYIRNILPAIRKIISLDGCEVVELGAGTGRLSSMIAPFVKYLRGFDISSNMLALAEKKLKITKLNNWTFEVADHRNIPLKDDICHLVLSGWSISYLVEKYPSQWKKELNKVFCETKRLLKPEGTIIILESLGTGKEKPSPPTKDLANYYKYLEEELNFSSTWIRTDYKFNTVEEGDKTVRFFFGDELADYIVKNGLTILPECTGLWWLRV